MLKSFIGKKLFKTGGIIFVACLLFVCFIQVYYSGFPEKEKKINGNILMAEGSYSTAALEKIKNEFQLGGYDKLIFTGLNYKIDYYKVAMNGYLIFYPRIRSAEARTETIHTIEVNVFSELGGQGRAHFNFFVNNSLIADFNAGMQKRKYGIRWKGKLEDIDSVMIQFDNDRYDKMGDRNLYVKEIIIDHRISIPFLYNSVYNIGPLNSKNRIINNYSSNSEYSKYELISMGIDSSRIYSVQGPETNINRTLSSALAFRDWLKASKYPVKGINIISSSLKAKRKCVIYNKILGKEYNIGIIPIPDFEHHGFLKRNLARVHEFFGLSYYWILLLRY